MTKEFTQPNEPIDCMHLAGHDPDINYHQWFTGKGMKSILICELCATDIQAGSLRLRCYTFASVATRNWKKRDARKGFVGPSEVLVRPSSLTLTQQHMPFPLTTPFLDLQPVNTNAESVWIALTGTSEFVRLDLTTQTITHLVHLPDSQLDRPQQISLHLAPNADCAAIVNTHGQYGIVMSLTTGAMTMPLERDTSHIEHSVFPLAFFECDDRLFLAHGTEWNRLDISDPDTGELISKRPTPFSQREHPRPKHFLDYFHARLRQPRSTTTILTLYLILPVAIEAILLSILPILSLLPDSLRPLE